MAGAIPQRWSDVNFDAVELATHSRARFRAYSSVRLNHPGCSLRVCKRARASITTTTAYTAPKAASSLRRDTLPVVITAPSVLDRAGYDVSKDGQKFLMAEPIGVANPPMVILNWLDEVRAKLRQQH